MVADSRSSLSPMPRLATDQVMLRVMATALPAVLLHSWFFGYGLVLAILLAAVVGLFTEAVCLRMRSQAIRPGLTDHSTLVTALLFAATMPAGADWWLLVLGMVFAIALVKQAYGGLGRNVFNPAMAGYLLLLLAFPQDMAYWQLPVGTLAPHPDLSPLAWSGLRESLGFVFPLAPNESGQLSQSVKAAPLPVPGLGDQGALPEVWRAQQSLLQRDLAIGRELVNLAWLAGGLMLLSLRIVSWPIPVAVIGSVLLLALLFAVGEGRPMAGSAYQQLFGSSTMIVAFFIATDPASAATSKPARIVYGLLIGGGLYVVRARGGDPHGAAIAVLLANFCAPMLDHLFRPRRSGATPDPESAGSHA